MSLAKPLSVQEPVEGLKVSRRHLAVQYGGTQVVEASLEAGTNARFASVNSLFAFFYQVRTDCFLVVNHTLHGRIHIQEGKNSSNIHAIHGPVRRQQELSLKSTEEKNEF